MAMSRWAAMYECAYTRSAVGSHGVCTWPCRQPAMRNAEVQLSAGAKGAVLRSRGSNNI